jgi:serine kinase of HPr protein (carbohydrate metabolism regulator)
VNLKDVIDALNLKVLTQEKDFSEQIPSAGYCADLLSCVMSGAPHQGIWVTLQAHTNIVAVGALLDLNAIIITEGAQPDEETIRKANDEGITLLSSDEKNFEICGKLWELGLRNQ